MPHADPPPTPTPPTSIDTPIFAGPVSRGAGAEARRWRGRGLVTGAGVIAIGVQVAGCVRPAPPGEPIVGAKSLYGVGDTPGRFMYPRAMEFGADGLWIIDRSGRVQRVSVETGQCTGLFRMPATDLGKPTGMFIGSGFGADGRLEPELLYIADTHYHRVVIVKPPALTAEDRTRAREGAPEIVKIVGENGSGPGQFTYPTDVAVLYGEDGRTPVRYYVSEYGGHDRVSVFDGAWNFQSSFGSFGGSAEAGNVQFVRPQSLAIAGKGSQRQLLVTDSCNHRVGVFTLEGRLVRWIGGRAPGPEETSGGSVALPSTEQLPSQTAAGPVMAATIGGPSRFLFPYGIQELSDGTVLIAEFGASRVQRVDLVNGTCLNSWGRPGREVGELAVPWEVRAMGTSAYVLDSGNNRVQRYALPVGAMEREWERSGALVGVSGHGGVP